MITVEVCAGITLSNPIGNGQDYSGGAILDLPDGKAANCIRLGWAKLYVPLSLYQSPEVVAEKAWPPRRYR